MVLNECQLLALKQIDIQDISLAGFDGYSDKSDNHYDTQRDYSFVKEKAEYLNKYVKSYLIPNPVVSERSL